MAGKIPTILWGFLVLGLLLMGVGYTMEQYYKAHIADKNGDGVVNWRDVDVNNDGIVDMRDVSAVARYADGRSSQGLERYDINEDGVIDRFDVELVAAYFGFGSLSILSLYSNQGKVFISGLLITVITVLGIIYNKTRR